MLISESMPNTSPCSGASGNVLGGNIFKNNRKARYFVRSGTLKKILGTSHSKYVLAFAGEFIDFEVAHAVVVIKNDLFRKVIIKAGMNRIMPALNSVLACSFRPARTARLVQRQHDFHSPVNSRFVHVTNGLGVRRYSLFNCFRIWQHHRRLTFTREHHAGPNSLNL